MLGHLMPCPARVLRGETPGARKAVEPGGLREVGERIPGHGDHQGSPWQAGCN